MAEISVVSFSTTGDEPQSGGAELLAERVQAPGRWRWIDVAGELDAATKRMLHEQLRVPILAIQDAGRTRHPPKLELLDEYSFLLLREVAGTGDRQVLAINQLSLFMNAHTVITVHAAQSAVVRDITALVTERGQTGAKDPATLGYLLCRRLADLCEPLILAQEESLARIEDDIFEGAGDSAVEALSRLNRILRRLRRVLTYQSKVFEQVQSRVREKVMPLDKHEATDLFENMDRLATLCQLNQELAVDLLNTHLGVMSHRLNIVMRILTVATIVFLPLGLLAGIYGMNFVFMPELSWQYGYFAVLGTMAVVAAGLTLFFKLKNWL